MDAVTHNQLYDTTRGPRAEEFGASKLHSQGEDLESLKVLVGDKKDADVLDLGCGAGHVAIAVAPFVRHVTALDLSDKMLAVVARKAAAAGISNVEPHRGAAEALPFEDDAFDFVFSRFAGRHWQDLPVVLKEARRVLRKGGSAVFMDTISPGTPLLDTFQQTIEMLRDPSHTRDYSAAEWVAAANAAGFVPHSITCRKLPVEFQGWIDRIGATKTAVEAIRELQNKISVEVRNYYSIEPDGSFTIDTMTLLVR